MYSLRVRGILHVLFKSGRDRTRFNITLLKKYCRSFKYYNVPNNGLDLKK
jgi:hypothetical protein